MVPGVGSDKYLQLYYSGQTDMNNTLMIINILSVTYYTFTGIVFIFIFSAFYTLIFTVAITINAVGWRIIIYIDGSIVTK